jgi:glyoxylase-like metal-dependent hydrolase (beta-lactamase superfamily II)
MRGLRLALLIAIMLVAASVASAQSEVVPGVWLIRGVFTPGSQPDGNSVIFTAPDGLVVVDTGRHPAHTEKIVAFARSAGRPVATVVNTHWHLDHIGGNAARRAAYPAVRIYASGALAGARSGFLAGYRKQLQEMIETTKDPEQRSAFESEVKIIDSSAALAPDVVISGTERKVLNGRRFLVGLETNAVTAGDVWLFDEDDAVLVAGDLITLPAPFLDTACPAKWKKALDRVAALKFDLVIPGHGAPLTRPQFETYRSAFAALLQCAGSASSKEDCANAWITSTASLTSDDPKFTRSLMAYYLDVLRDPEKTRTFCGG